MRTSQQHTQSLGWLPAFEDMPPMDHTSRKAQRSNKLARDMRDKVRNRKAEDQHIMDLADYYCPFLEA